MNNIQLKSILALLCLLAGSLSFAACPKLTTSSQLIEAANRAQGYILRITIANDGDKSVHIPTWDLPWENLVGLQLFIAQSNGRIFTKKHPIMEPHPSPDLEILPGSFASGDIQVNAFFNEKQLLRGSTGKGLFWLYAARTSWGCQEQKFRYALTGSVSL